MKRLLLLPCLLICLMLTACAPWEDAVALFTQWGDGLQSVFAGGEEDAGDEAPSTSSEPDGDPSSGSDVQTALGIVCNGFFQGYPDKSVSALLIGYFPGGNWSSTATAVDFFSTAQIDGETVDVHFGFRVQVDTNSFTLDVCEAGDAAYTEETLPELFALLD